MLNTFDCLNLHVVYLEMPLVFLQDGICLVLSLTIIKKGAWIGYGNTFANQVVEENTRLRNIRPAPNQGVED
jgi:hypothetical protein